MHQKCKIVNEMHEGCFINKLPNGIISCANHSQWPFAAHTFDSSFLAGLIDMLQVGFVFVFLYL